MYRRVVALSSVHHGALRIRSADDHGHARGLHMASVMQAEIVRAAAIYPIVFVEDAQADLFRPVALFGLEPGDNAFVDALGQWHASYIPAVVRGYPFALVRTGKGDRHALCIDRDSERVSEVDGTPLFDAEGRPTPALEEARAYFTRLRQMQLVTDAYVRALEKRNLLTPLSLRAQRDGRAVELQGCFVVNEARLDALSLESLAELRSRGWLAATYAQIASLHQLERLE